MKTYLIPALIAFVGLNTLGTFNGPMSKIFGLALLALAAWMVIKQLKGASKTGPDANLKAQLSGFNYHHYHDKSGIALDSAKREIHLVSRGEYKVYPFEKIRTWETNIATGGLTMYAPNMASSLAATAQNMRQQRENKSNTGLFIDVKDVDHPRWHIEFQAKDIQRQLERWMEILRQEVNEA